MNDRKRKDQNMKRALRQLIMIVLIAAFVFCMAGCGSAKSGLLDEKVSGMVDCFAARDADGAYSLIYPGITDIENYRTGLEELYEYFPVAPGYTLERQNFSSKKTLGSGSEILEGQYQVEFSGSIFYIVAAWRSDSDGSGFTTFYAFNEEDWAKAQKKEQS